MFKKVCQAGIVLVIAASVFGAGCSRPSATPGAADAKWAEQRWPGTTIGQLEHGRGVFVSRCSSCHNLPDPAQKTADEWPAAVEEMAERARLSERDKTSVVRYLATMSARAPATGG